MEFVTLKDSSSEATVQPPLEKYNVHIRTGQSPCNEDVILQITGANDKTEALLSVLHRLL